MKRMRLGQIKIIVFAAIIMVSLFGFSKPVNAREYRNLKNVLIINSYQEGFRWTKQETDGIMDELTKSGGNISTYVEYMDWKNCHADKNLNYLYNYYKYKYQHKKLDMIITTDDAALQFALFHRQEIFSNAPIVFCGVNQYGVSTLLRGFDKVTGVVENINASKTVKIALHINPSIKNIYLLYDNTESGISTGNLITRQIKSMKIKQKLNIIPCNDMAFRKIDQKVRHLGKDSIVMIVSYSRDVNNKNIDMSYVTRKISKDSSVPTYHIYDYEMNNGTIGGSLMSGDIQGVEAGRLALQVLNGKDIRNLPIETRNTNHIIFDYKQLHRFGISTKVLPKNAKIINKPFSFYDTYKKLVVSVSAIVIILILFVNILLFYLIRIKRMKRNLAESHEELTQIYEELSASDEEMRQQYDEIISYNEKIRLSEDKLNYLAYHDALTGLPNRLSLYEKSKEVLVPENGNVALIFIDIDNFKYVNDTMGHAFGDQLIIKVGERLSALLHPKDTIYRLSGDEFIIMMENVKDAEEINRFAALILNRFTEEFEIFNSSHHISLSFGIVQYPEQGSNIEQLLKYADIAMYRAKEAGRKNFVMYDQIMNQVFTERVNMEKLLLKALDNNEFELYYQPQLDVKSNQITGFEALIRWISPELGMVPPLKFINIAEDTHFIIPLGTWVLKKTCLFLRKLYDLGFNQLSASINISILQLMQTDFYEVVENVLKETKLEPENIELEITESILMESFESIRQPLDKLCSNNIMVALDDFGTGYSSLYYLKQLPISTLKIDKAFIDDISDINSKSITGQIIIFGKWLGMNVIAEGVEQQVQLDYLKKFGCDKYQGYLYSKPVPEEEFMKLLNDNK